MDLKSYQLIASDKSSLLRKNLFLLKSGFQVMVFFILLEAGYLVKIAVTLYIRKLFSRHYKMFDRFMFSKYFLQLVVSFHYGHVSLLFFIVEHQNVCRQILKQ